MIKIMLAMLCIWGCGKFELGTKKTADTPKNKTVNQKYKDFKFNSLNFRITDHLARGMVTEASGRHKERVRMADPDGNGFLLNGEYVPFELKIESLSVKASDSDYLETLHAKYEKNTRQRSNIYEFKNTNVKGRYFDVVEKKGMHWVTHRMLLLDKKSETARFQDLIILSVFKDLNINRELGDFQGDFIEFLESLKY